MQLIIIKNTFIHFLFLNIHFLFLQFTPSKGRIQGSEGERRIERNLKKSLEPQTLNKFQGVGERETKQLLPPPRLNPV